MSKLLPKLYPYILFLLGLLFFVPFLGYLPLFDTAEIRPAEVAREMLATNTFRYAQLDFLPAPGVPPLMSWLQALSMRVFGVADSIELAARFPSALVGIVTLLTLFFIGRKKHDARFGLLWALGYLGSVTPFILAKSALPATTGHLFNFLGIVYLFGLFPTTQNRGELRSAGLAGLFFGLAILTNGVLIASFLLIALLLTGYAQMSEQTTSAKIRKGLAVLFFPVLCSVGWLVSVPGNDWMRALSPSRDLSIFPYTLLGVVGILTPIVLSSRYWSANKLTDSSNAEITFEAWMSKVAKQAVIFVVFSPGGILVVWFPLAYLATYHIQQVLRGERQWDKLSTYLLVVSGLLISLLMLAVPVLGLNSEWLAQRITDSFWSVVVQAPVSWAGWEWVIGVALILLTTFFTLRIRRHPLQSVIGLYGSSAVCTLAFAAIILPKIEQYTQGPYINFCEARWGQPVFIQPAFPGYAHLLYTRKKPPVDPKKRELVWFNGRFADKPGYVVATDSIDVYRYRYNPDFELEQEENGYVFFRRKQFR